MARSRDVLTTTHEAQLSSDFGYDWACKLFGKDAIDSLKRLSRGPNKGKPAGRVIWIKAAHAGYSRWLGHAVSANYLLRAEVRIDGEIARGMWMGRVQDLSGSRPALFEEGRQRAARDEMIRQADELATRGDYHKHKGESERAIAAYEDAAAIYDALDPGQATLYREAAEELR